MFYQTAYALLKDDQNDIIQFQQIEVSKAQGNLIK